MKRYEYYEFFAGGGMVRAALDQDRWICKFANDFDRKKSEYYKLNWHPENLHTKDVRAVQLHELSGCADLAWASFPCQDLSLAGGGAGLKGERSGTYWPFWRIMEGLIKDGRGPKIIALENVCGTLTSHGGKDFSEICNNFRKNDYQFGAIVIDAAKFVPQSRPRLFVIGIHSDITLPDFFRGNQFNDLHTRSLVKAHSRLSRAIQSSWIWWTLPAPPKRELNFVDVIEEEPTGVQWHSPEDTQKLISMMSDVHIAKLNSAKRWKKLKIGALYKRTRIENGIKTQRAEIRFDDIAGCLRTPAGGSSRQVIFVVKSQNVKSRLLSTRETARLMGLADDYIMPDNYNEGYHLTGDGVAVPVVKFLSEHIFEPILRINSSIERAAA